MTELAIDAAIDAAELLTHYSFDLGGFTVERLIDYWLREYPANWLRPALVEALYQGRYKAVSVTQILTLWKRRGQPLYHFNHEFERMICGKFSRTSITPSEPPTSGRTPNRTSSLSSDRPSAATLLEPPEATKPPSSDKAESLTSKPLEQNSPGAAIEAESAEARVDHEPSKQEPLEQEPLRSPQQSSDRSIRALLPAAKPSAEPSPVPPPEAVPPAITPTGIPESSATSTTAESAEVSREQPPFTVPIQPTSSEGKIESPIQTFKPVNAGIDATELAQWAGDRVSKHPIHQFVPATGVSNFYAKLKAVVQSRDDFTDLALAGDSVSFQDQRERE